MNQPDIKLIYDPEALALLETEYIQRKIEAEHLDQNQAIASLEDLRHNAGNNNLLFGVLSHLLTQTDTQK